VKFVRTFIYVKAGSKYFWVITNEVISRK